jgi:serine/threonine protein kinase
LNGYEDWILRNEQERQPLDKRLVVEGVVRGLSEAHQNGIAHCDLKPANILLAVADGSVVPKIADFGLGRAQVGRSDASAQASQAGVGGTTMYLPPESLQPFVQRSPFKDDIFAVGVVWYQVLVGRLERPPYDFANHLRDNLVDSQTIRVIERCLAQPDRRFKDASELEQSLDSLPQVPDWTPPPDCFDVQHLAREYLTSQA